MSPNPSLSTQPPRSPLALLPLLSVGAFASQASIRMADPMLPQLATEFGSRVADLSGVITAFAISYGLMQLFYGPVADRFGKLRVIAWACAAAAITSLACALAAGPLSLTVLRFLAGAACAGLIPLTLAWIGDTVPYAQRQPVLARFMLGSTLGQVTGQVMGGLFADTLGWRLSFLGPSLIFLAVAIALWRNLRGAHASASAGSAAGGATRPLAAFARVLKSGWARTVLILVFLEGALAFGMLAFVPSWLHERHGLTVWQTGLAAAGFGLGGVAYSILAPWMVARLGERGLALGGAVLLSIGLGLLGGPLWTIEIGKSALAGAGFFMMHSTLQTLATQMLPELRGTAIAAFALALFVGQSGGVALTAALSGPVGFETVQRISAPGLLVLGVVLTLLLKQRQGVPPAAG